MLQLLLCFVVNQLNDFLIWLPNFPLNLLSLFNYYRYYHTSCSKFNVTLYTNFRIWVFFCFILHDIAVRWYCHIYQHARFLFSASGYIWPISWNFCICEYHLISRHCHISCLHAGVCVWVSPNFSHLYNCSLCNILFSAIFLFYSLLRCPLFVFFHFEIFSWEF